ncbi:hypothetical protein [Methanohalophilus portucalensis]|uniref:ArnR1-like winged helix-turn-helix domain-containing protein n=2 Tax=Methanohalophilus portucalensis TaxID=39664 RepID=A0A1L9C3R8_9EURY|nr:hypothetical protein [Methanohalophilus portucalensis]ATU07966.1 hypothetical protein BKM01_03775 [Methanohalophilus portucalensis]OJH49189.1 hypothetical protein MPF_1056 [Methanohalophilus portucalensis FDF-1]RNI11683.1 hypothetical protein EFE41_05625 [Methanohalophilus portucalensis FDF-1]SMH42626.1 hypothetical protein SAMN06264941_1815 [Methanohalophilus portucalensis FDF-1]
MSGRIDIATEKAVAEFYQSLGIINGPGDIQYRIIIKVLEMNEGEVVEFSDIRKYTDPIADRGSIGSKMKTVILLSGLANKVKRGGYTITEKGMIAADYLHNSTEFYFKAKKTMAMIDRMP